MDKQQAIEMMRRLGHEVTDAGEVLRLRQPGGHDLVAGPLGSILVMTGPGPHQITLRQSRSASPEHISMLVDYCSEDATLRSIPHVETREDWVRNRIRHEIRDLTRPWPSPWPGFVARHLDHLNTTRSQLLGTTGTTRT